MLFNSYTFIFFFLPVALGGYFLCVKFFGRTAAISWLAIASLVFYGCWNLSFVPLLLISIAFNYTIGSLLGDDDSRRQDWLLTTGIVGNLAALIYYKYLASALVFLSSYGLISPGVKLDVILPLGISFFTFTQIGYLVDRRQGLGERLGLLRYVVFVTFFPHLIAGPILHIRDIAPQFADEGTFRIGAQNLAVGLTLFIIGLSKKVLLADPLAPLVNAGFAHPDALSLYLSWIVGLAYSLQLYFDFSGYSDMAIGLAYMFGFKFPTNFNSPYKSRSIIEFWQRWHMTLSRYLGLLLYNPIAMWVSRRRARRGLGSSRRDTATPGAFASTILLPTFVTMTLAGIWHGAGLQFAMFGLLHASYLSINHAWRVFGPRKPATPRGKGWQMVVTCGQVLLTYCAIVVSIVLFRAATLGSALEFYAGMIGFHGLGVPHTLVTWVSKLGLDSVFASWLGVFDAQNITLVSPSDLLSLALRFVGVWALPNSQQIMARFAPTLPALRAEVSSWVAWRPAAVWAVCIGVVFCINVMRLRQTTVFLYFQF
jgi:alginate O-acetyltransferase complex protein AlgI